jgi:hypothetical protein
MHTDRSSIVGENERLTTAGDWERYTDKRSHPKVIYIYSKELKMSDYEIGKDIRDLEIRITQLENLRNKDPDLTQTRNVTEADLPCFPNLDITLVDSKGEEVSEDNRKNLMYPDPRILEVKLSGGCERWNTGFPRWENLSSYSGNVWLQRKDNGDRIVFHYIQTGSTTDCKITFGSGDLQEARNSYACGYGYGRRALAGRLTFCSWGKFRFADGYGYDVAKWTCFC